MLDKEWLHAFLAEYRKKIAIPFSCNIRIDQVDEEIIKDMAQSKCVGIMFGIESGSEKIRNKILQKNLRQETIINNAKIIKKYGIRLVTSNMFGLPEETLADALQTLTINQKIKPYCTRPNILIPYPKTEIAEYAVSHGFVDSNFSIMNFDQHLGKSVVESDDIKKINNLCALFRLWVKFPSLNPFFKLMLNFPFPRALSLFRFYEGFESMLYHGLFNIRGLRYSFHIIKNVTRNVYH